MPDNRVRVTERQLERTLTARMGRRVSREMYRLWDLRLELARRRTGLHPLYAARLKRLERVNSYLLMRRMSHFAAIYPGRG